MKKTLLTLALVAGVTAAFAQGTVQFSNGALSKLSTSNLDGSGTAVMPATAGLFEFGLFYGIGSSASMQLVPGVFGVNSTSTAGIISSPTDAHTAITLVGIPGTNPNETDVFLQMRAWSASFGTDWQAAQTAFLAGQSNVGFKESNIANANALGASTGPGINIWQGATATNTHLINAFVIPVNPLVVTPEPTSLALFGLGAAGLMIFRRRK